ncbi:hypothetical protein DIJ64_00860 [Mycobacterium leprae]|uniref:Uncharacterized protein n=1 Tax=Mycobacterium leprae TaxID=1769 RepID=A0AAD0P731_MYCLR|nr:hypothetical protein DIJ64_00860 [Mycobacterium leprae]
MRLCSAYANCPTDIMLKCKFSPTPTAPCEQSEIRHALFSAATKRSSKKRCRRCSGAQHVCEPNFSTHPRLDKSNRSHRHRNGEAPSL